MNEDQARRDVQETVQKAVTWAEATEDRSFFVFEANLWTLVLAIGRALVALFLAQRAGRPRPTNYEQDGRKLVISGSVINDLGTLFGKVTWQRPTGMRRVTSREIKDLPVDRELGLCGGFSFGVIQRLGKLSAQMPFEPALKSFKEVHLWAPSQKALLRMVDALGAEARPYLEACSAPPGDGEVVVIQVDSGGVPALSSLELALRRLPRADRDPAVRGRRSRSTGEEPKRKERGRQQRRARYKQHPKVRRTKGKKSKNAKMAVVGVIYTLRRTPHGLEGPINKRMVATFHSHKELCKWLRTEADKRGYGTKPTYFLADGCEHIWEQQKVYFPEAIVCLDWFHVVEKLWKAGGCLHREGSAALKSWVDEQKGRLRHGQLSRLLEVLEEARAGIAKTGPGNKSKRERLDQVIAHLKNNRHRLSYKQLRAQDMDIATGVVEAAVRTLVRQRLDSSGMRWGRGRSELVLHLRCILINGQWDDFANLVASRGPLKLRARPIPAQSHDARQQKGA